MLRPPVLFGPRPPGVELSVPPALEDVLAGGEPIVVHTNAYFGKGAQVSAEHMAFSFHTEHVGGDKVAGDQIIAGDKVSAPAPGEAGDHAEGPKDAQGALGPVASRGPQPGPVRCGRCGHECPADARFCLRCGARLPGRCPSCARPAAPGDRFCTACGAALDPTPQ
ncbi:MAG: hypothetical protein AMK73_07755 [Planctomycetes bacterium SM23_32]|nr:MAG: hypothetical protein AMK73_07755 [Planctomycetes bacterium SM23_32]